MVDDRTQRPFRSNELPMRGAPAGAAGPQAGDPLAELARLIGQNDPFADRDGAPRGASPPRRAEPPPDWNAPPPASYPPQGGYPQQAAPSTAPNFNGDYYPAHPAYPQEAPQFAPPPMARQPYANPGYGGGDPNYADHEAGGYADPRSGGHPGGYEGGPYYPNRMHPGDDAGDAYDDAPPARRRMGIMAIAAVFALAVIGTAGAFGYRALFGSSGLSGPPPVIKADASPSKIVPAVKTKELQNNKMIYDRVNDRGQGEKVVSREEQPVDMQAKGAGFPTGQSAPLGSAQPVMGSGVVGTEPKKVHTITIHPDQPVGTAGSAPVREAPAAAMRQPPARVASEPPQQQHRQPTVVAAAAPAVRHTTASAPSGSPLSLNPDAPPPAAATIRSAPAVMRTASVAPTQIVPPAAARTRNVAAGSSGAYNVQVSSQRSEAEAQAAFQSLQGKYPGQLGGRAPIIHRVDLGAKGIYFRAMVGPFASSEEAGQLCSGLKAAGASCIVQKN